MSLAAVEYADGGSVASPPPSLKVYSLAKRLPGLWGTTDLLDGDGQLLAELMVYAAEEGRAANERVRREERETRNAQRGAGRVAGRKGSRR